MKRRPSMTATAIGSVRGVPDFRPRIVTRRFGPAGRPNLRAALKTGPGARTHHGALDGRRGGAAWAAGVAWVIELVLGHVSSGLARQSTDGATLENVTDG